MLILKIHAHYSHLTFCLKEIEKLMQRLQIYDEDIRTVKVGWSAITYLRMDGYSI